MVIVVPMASFPRLILLLLLLPPLPPVPKLAHEIERPGKEEGQAREHAAGVGGRRRLGSGVAF